MRLNRYCLFIALAMLIVTGCTSTPPAKHYFLSPLDQPDKAILSRGEGSKLDISAVDVHVRVASYLDRPQIVTRTGPNALRIDEFNRWPGSFADQITNTLIQNLSVLLGNVIVARRPLPAAMGVDHHVFIDIIQFDGVSGQSVTLLANWGVFAKGDKDQEIFPPQRFKSTLPVESTAYESMVAVQSRALGDLSREIAQTIVWNTSTKTSE